MEAAGQELPARHRIRRRQRRADERQYSGNVISTIDVLAAAGLLIEDRPTRIERYFAAKTSTLPPVMKDQLEV